MARHRVVSAVPVWVAKEEVQEAHPAEQMEGPVVGTQVVVVGLMVADHAAAVKLGPVCSSYCLIREQAQEVQMADQLLLQAAVTL